MPTVTLEGRKYTVRSGETVLEALLRQGSTILFSCGKGSCNACMQRCTRGSVPPAAQRGLKPSLVELGYLLPCICQPTEDMCLEAPHAEDFTFNAEIVGKRQLSRDVCRLLLELETDFTYRAGQFVNVVRSNGLTRSYSLASVHGEEPYLELHVQRISTGVMSNWLHDAASVGQRLVLQGPFGDNVYGTSEPRRLLVLIGSGTGVAPLYGIAKEALFARHEGHIHLFHAGVTRDDLYLNDELIRLDHAHNCFHYHPYVVANSSDTVSIAEKTGISDCAFRGVAQIRNARIHVAGQPATVARCIRLAEETGIDLAMVSSDAFETARRTPAAPAPISSEPAEFGPRSFLPDPQMWVALDDGRLLMAILEDFYVRVFADERLSAYFQHVTRQRIVEKVYSYLKQAFTGERAYFGNHPRNAHHWMVIDNDLFDYRERMLRECISRKGLPDHLIDRWLLLEEQFRPDIVKDKPWSRVVGAMELPVEGFGEMALEVGSLCDACGNELGVGEMVRYHVRLGTIYGACCNSPEDWDPASGGAHE